MDLVYELIGEGILAEIISKQLNKEVNVEVKIFDISRNQIEVLFKDEEDEIIDSQLIEFSNLKEEQKVFIDRLYDAFFKNTKLNLCVQNLRICETNPDSEVLSFDTSNERIKQVNEASAKALSFKYDSKKDN
ncbi:MAG: hypothetical protein J6J17_00070 [Bacilli bacterium]|nr:hypothetical protein [Bacilli bacterium]